MKISSVQEILNFEDCYNIKMDLIKSCEKRTCNFDPQLFAQTLQELKTTLSDLYEQAKKGYVQPISSIHKEKLKKLYEKEIKHTVAINLNCPSCVLDMIRKIGALYEKKKNKMK